MRALVFPTILVALACLICGCPAPADPMPELRAACYYLTDAEIRSFLALYEQAQSDGVSKGEAVATILATCDTADCMTCAMAMIDSAYGD